MKIGTPDPDRGPHLGKAAYVTITSKPGESTCVTAPFQKPSEEGWDAASILPDYHRHEPSSCYLHVGVG